MGKTGTQGVHIKPTVREREHLTKFGRINSLRGRDAGGLLLAHTLIRECALPLQPDKPHNPDLTYPRSNAAGPWVSWARLIPGCLPLLLLCLVSVYDTFTCGCVGVRTRAHGEARSGHWVSSSLTPTPYFLRQNLSLYPEPIHSATVSQPLSSRDWPVPICTHLPQAYRYRFLCPHLPWVLRTHNYVIIL